MEQLQLQLRFSLPATKKVYSAQHVFDRFATDFTCALKAMLHKACNQIVDGVV